MSSRPRIKTFRGKLQSGSLKDSGFRRNDTLCCPSADFSNEILTGADYFLGNAVWNLRVK